jgi:hypothetical protein
MNMRTAVVALLALSLTACGGDTTPLPPLTVGPEWMPVMMDTTGNIVMRRMAMWVDTQHVTRSPAGYALTAQRMHMDMKMGGISTTMRTKMEMDCAGRRYRMAGLDSMSASMKGTPMPDSVAKQAMAQQSGKLNDTTWIAVAPNDAGDNGTMFTAVCARAAAAAPAPAPAPAVK